MLNRISWPESKELKKRACASALRMSVSDSGEGHVKESNCDAYIFLDGSLQCLAVTGNWYEAGFGAIPDVKNWGYFRSGFNAGHVYIDAALAVEVKETDGIRDEALRLAREYFPNAEVVPESQLDPDSGNGYLSVRITTGAFEKSDVHKIIELSARWRRDYSARASKVRFYLWG